MEVKPKYLDCDPFLEDLESGGDFRLPPLYEKLRGEDDVVILPPAGSSKDMKRNFGSFDDVAGRMYSDNYLCRSTTITRPVRCPSSGAIF